MIRKKILFTSTLFFLIGCNQKSIEFARETINVHPNEPFTISLESNPSTGYQWTICNYTPSGPIKLKDCTFEPNKKTELIGAPGTESFNFETEKIEHQAIVYLTFNYVGPGEDGTKPAKQIHYTININ